MIFGEKEEVRDIFWGEFEFRVLGFVLVLDVLMLVLDDVESVCFFNEGG